MAMTNKKAQGIVEYTLLLTAVLLVMLYAIGSPTGPVRKGLVDFFNGLGTQIGKLIEEVIK